MLSGFKNGSRDGHVLAQGGLRDCEEQHFATSKTFTYIDLYTLVFSDLPRLC